MTITAKNKTNQTNIMRHFAVKKRRLLRLRHHVAFHGDRFAGDISLQRRSVAWGGRVLRYPRRLRLDRRLNCLLVVS